MDTYISKRVIEYQVTKIQILINLPICWQLQSVKTLGF